MISKILIAVKDAHLMNVTEDFLAGLENKGLVSLKVLHAIVPDQTIASELKEELRNEAAALMESTCKRLARHFPTLKVTGCIREGQVNQVIVEEAADWSADLILMGPYGRRGSDEFLQGSEANIALSNSPCSVVLLRGQHEKFKNQSSPAFASLKTRQ